jgi:hypothetical protein
MALPDPINAVPAISIPSTDQPIVADTTTTICPLQFRQLQHQRLFDIPRVNVQQLKSSNSFFSFLVISRNT